MGVWVVSRLAVRAVGVWKRGRKRRNRRRSRRLRVYEIWYPSCYSTIPCSNLQSFLVQKEISSTIPFKSPLTTGAKARLIKRISFHSSTSIRPQRSYLNKVSSEILEAGFVYKSSSGNAILGLRYNNSTWKSVRSDPSTEIFTCRSVGKIEEAWTWLGIGKLRGDPEIRTADLWNERGLDEDTEFKLYLTPLYWIISVIVHPPSGNTTVHI